MTTVAEHYDLLIENSNDPVNDGEELKRYMDKWDGQVFIDELELNKEKRCLEIGCGTGRILQKILDNYESYTGIDISPKTIVRASEHFKSDKIKFICGDFLSYDFSEDYDVIFATLTFMHIKDKEKAIKKVFNLLTKGGKFVLSIDKNQSMRIDTGYSVIKIYPDNKRKIENCLLKVGFSKYYCKELELSYVYIVNK